MCGGGGGRLSMIFILATAPWFDAAIPLPAFARLFMAPDVKSDDKSSTNLWVWVLMKWKPNTIKNNKENKTKQKNKQT